MNLTAVPRATDGDASPSAPGLTLRRAHRRAAMVGAQARRPLGVELRHFDVLIALVDRGPTAQRDLATATGSGKPGIPRVVDDLERDGPAVRRTVPGTGPAAARAAVEATRAGHPRAGCRGTGTGGSRLPCAGAESDTVIRHDAAVRAAAGPARSPVGTRCRPRTLARTRAAAPPGAGQGRRPGGRQFIRPTAGQIWTSSDCCCLNRTGVRDRLQQPNGPCLACS